jgi:hypothetical protein
MKNDWKKLKVILLIALFMMGCTKINQESMKYNGKGNISQPVPQGYQLIISNPDRGVFVYGKKLDSKPYFNQVLVRTKETQREFNWKATMRTPGLMFADLTGTGEENIVMVFVTSYGTGIYEPQIHVLNKDLTKEIEVEVPALAAKRLITSTLQGQEIIFKSGDKEYRVKPQVGSGGIAEEYKNLQYGSVATYRIEDNKLKATVTVQTNPSSFLGEFTLSYSYREGRLIPVVEDFKKFD